MIELYQRCVDEGEGSRFSKGGGGRGLEGEDEGSLEGEADEGGSVDAEEEEEEVEEVVEGPLSPFIVRFGIVFIIASSQSPPFARTAWMRSYMCVHVRT